MKKTVYNDVSISYFANGEVASLAAEGEEAEALAAMAHAHQDIHWHGANDYIIPWSAVLGVTITKSIEDVSAPYDAICGGCEHPGAYLKLKDGVTFCYYTDADTSDMRANMYLNGNLVEAPYSAEVLAQVCELTLDCEPLVATQGDIVSVEPNPDDENYVVTFYAADDEGTEATTNAVAPTACE